MAKSGKWQHYHKKIHSTIKDVFGGISSLIKKDDKDKNEEEDNK